MKVIIIEDEQLAARRLVRLLQEYDSQIEVTAILESVEDSVAWLRTHAPPDLAFVDIQLADGLSFQIFETVELAFPLIFTTAYDEYAIRAFKLNSIDYLLKPISEADLTAALAKYQRWQQPASPAIDIRQLQSLLAGAATRTYKERFIVKAANRLLAIETVAIHYFYSENKITWLRDEAGRKHAVNFTLDELESLLAPTAFFRINRKVIVGLAAITEVIPYTNSRFRVRLLHTPDDEMTIISRDRVNDFKAWWSGCGE